MRNKTDKHDTRGIAQILRSGWSSRVHVKSIESHHIGMLLASRRAVLSKCVDLENEVRGLFNIFGLRLPPKLGHRALDDTVHESRELCTDEPDVRSTGIRHAGETLAAARLN